MIYIFANIFFCKLDQDHRPVSVNKSASDTFYPAKFLYKATQGNKNVSLNTHVDKNARTHSGENKDIFTWKSTGRVTDSRTYAYKIRHTQETNFQLCFCGCHNHAFSCEPSWALCTTLSLALIRKIATRGILKPLWNKTVWIFYKWVIVEELTWSSFLRTILFFGYYYFYLDVPERKKSFFFWNITTTCREK